MCGEVALTHVGSRARVALAVVLAGTIELFSVTVGSIYSALGPVPGPPSEASPTLATVVPLSSAPARSPPVPLTPRRSAPRMFSDLQWPETSPTPDPADPTAAPLPWTALATAPPWKWITLDAPPRDIPPQEPWVWKKSWDHPPPWEPMAYLAWAEQIAQAWAPDAVVVELKVDANNFEHRKIPPNFYGVQYVAVSPSRFAVSQAVGDVGLRPPPSAVAIKVYRVTRFEEGKNIEESHISAALVSGWEPPPPGSPPLESACTVRQVVFEHAPRHPGGCGFMAPSLIDLGWHDPPNGPPFWMYEVTVDQESYYVSADDCLVWTGTIPTTAVDTIRSYGDVHYPPTPVVPKKPRRIPLGPLEYNPVNNPPPQVDEAGPG